MAYPPPVHGYPPPHPGYPPAAPGYDPGYPPQGYPGYPPAAYPPPGAYGSPYGAPPPGYPPHPGYAPPPHPGYGPPPPAYGHPPPYGYPPHPGYPPPAWGHPGYPPHPGFYERPDRSRSRSRGGARGDKFTCRFFIGIENDAEFQVVKRIIGARGSKMKEIVARSGGEAKLRLRGKGSGFVERDTKEESSEPLQLCISCPVQDGYEIARDQTQQLMRSTYDDHRKWCAEKGLPETTPAEVKVTEKHLKGDGQGGGGGRRGGRNNRDRTPPRGRKDQQRRQPLHAVADGPSDDSTPPPGAPSVEEIKRMIADRNTARRAGDFGEADRIRNSLKDQHVVLSDEKGGHGDAKNVTSWRYWTE